MGRNKAKYPKIIEKNNLAPTQMRVDNFRETLTEIVKKQHIGEGNRFNNKKTLESKEIEILMKQRNRRLR